MRCIVRCTGVSVPLPMLVLVLAVAGGFTCPRIASASIPNVVMITDESGADRSDYPIQFGRPFLRGEIPTFPQVLVDGSPVLTQADVKNRHDDGSVKFAVLSFVIPFIPSAQAVAITFQDQPSGNNTPVPVKEMLSGASDFDATMRLTGKSGARTASAAEMLANGHFRYWTEGPVATTIILADHTSRKYDLGFDNFRPFRPVFHAAFWPRIHKIRIRFIGEIANSAELEDVSVTDLELTVGRASPVTVYKLPSQKSPLNMGAATRWTREFWIGGEPDARVNIDYNLPYLIQTRYIPNFDTSISIPESAITGQYSLWQKSKRDLYDAGRWQRAMGTGGGRPDIGPYPLWPTHWLYTGDWRAAEVALQLANLAAAWPLHLREGQAGKWFDREETIDGLGRVLSINARPGLCLSVGYNYSYTKADDKVTVVGPIAANEWHPDGAHQPDPYSVAYTLTGDYWYLEQMQLWAAYSAARYNGPAVNTGYGRGPTGREGGIRDEVRGDAWVIRSRASTAFLSPDGSAEKDFFTTLTNDALAVWEGERHIRGTAFENTPVWNWAFQRSQQGTYGKWSVIINHQAVSIGPPPLSFWENNTAITDNDGTNGIPVGGGTSPWMQDYLIYSLGRVKELGFASDALVQSVGSNLVSQLTDPAFNPYLTGAYHTPVMKSDFTYFQSWGEVLQGYPLALRTLQTWPSSAYPTLSEGYTFISMAAASMVGDLPNGPRAWSKLREMIGDNLAVLAPDPRYAILPRPTEEPAPPENPAVEIPAAQ